MIKTLTPIAAQGYPTVWGLDPIQLHDHFWAARGVHVVRQGQPGEIPRSAELFLLSDPRTLTIFPLRDLVDQLSWTDPEILFVRLSNSRDRGYREIVVSDERGQFVRFTRSYGGSDARLARVALTRHLDIARFWQQSPDARSAWRGLRRRVRRLERAAASVAGRAYDRSSDGEVAQFVRDLVQYWQKPDSTIRNVKRLAPSVWAHESVRTDRATRFVGAAWIGAGRSVEGVPAVLGPAALWDDPGARPMDVGLRWEEIEPTAALARPVRPKQYSSFQQASKRAFDFAFALIMLLLTLPIYPLVMLAIWLEDGRPFFFAHRRETMGGREFPCLKFRSMRKDADEIKRQLQKQNQADGPQFFMENDPRLTRVGRIIRKLNIDELPQFFNVLLGQMAVVGPRPSPRKENQYCPPWREARLSVRPGITGLWQVMRTRRQGLDFQEWIKYDIEYVENASWRMDLSIICRTIGTILRGVFH